MRLMILSVLLLVTGCATPPQFLANMYDSNDPCQRTELIKEGKYPQWCGGGSGKRYVTRDFQSGRAILTTKAEK